MTNEELQNKVLSLEKKLDDLSNEIHDSRFITNPFKDNVLGIVLTDRDTTTTLTQTLSLSGEAEDISVPITPTGLIKTSFRGNNIGLFYKTL